MKKQLGPVPVTNGTEAPSRMAILMWGQAGCGKSTFAATAPGKKLWLSFGDNEHASVMHRKDVEIANLSGLSVEDLFKHIQNDNPLGLDQYLVDNQDVLSVVCDSLTAIAFRALQKAVRDRIGASGGFVPTMEAPGLSAYGGRNGITLEVMTGLLRVTAKHGVHLIATAHEADPVTRKEQRNDVIDHITVMLGGQLVNNMTWRLSEIWYMSQEKTGDRERRIAIRPTRLRKPMKTRMFTNAGVPEFALDYDCDKPDKGQSTIASWFEQWEKQSWSRLPIPTVNRKRGT